MWSRWNAVWISASCIAIDSVRPHSRCSGPPPGPSSSHGGSGGLRLAPCRPGADSRRVRPPLSSRPSQQGLRTLRWLFVPVAAPAWLSSSGGARAAWRAQARALGGLPIPLARRRGAPIMASSSLRMGDPRVGLDHYDGPPAAVLTLGRPAVKDGQLAGRAPPPGGSASPGPCRPRVGAEEFYAGGRIFAPEASEGWAFERPPTASSAPPGRRMIGRGPLAIGLSDGVL